MSLFKLTAYGFVCSAAYYLCPKRIRWVILLVFSYGFYATRAFASLPFILTTTLTTWVGALMIGRIAERSKALLREKKETLTPRKKRISRHRRKTASVC